MLEEYKALGAWVKLYLWERTCLLKVGCLISIEKYQWECRVVRLETFVYTRNETDTNKLQDVICNFLTPTPPSPSAGKCTPDPKDSVAKESQTVTDNYPAQPTAISKRRYYNQEIEERQEGSNYREIKSSLPQWISHIGGVRF